ncbi:MAG: GspE/PulE family protein [Candidatus Eisenbacteria bacterium]|jgi:general secretion pathway protein E|nr:GspE/PulE family protein [Candidatus Eisenbacteria bacterium]
MPASTNVNGIPRSVALHYAVAPMEVIGDLVSLVAAEPLSSSARAEIEQLTRVRVGVVTVAPEVFRTQLVRLYGIGAAAIAAEDAPGSEGESVLPPDAGVVRFVDELIAEAGRRRATDLHVEPSLDCLGIRLRIDGLLQPVPAPHDLAKHGRRIAARVKVMAGLDPTPSMIPREGRIRTDGRDLRISVLPTPHGEAVHVRFLPSPTEFPVLQDLGISPEAREILGDVMRVRSGLLVACGPTGSGKSTTLHVLLRTGVPSTEKIITVEDPVEIQIPGAVQVEVGPQLSFAQALRAVLRHDPDVILVGEMRDAESARIAMQAALTGHLVLTSLHTDDEAQAVTRLNQLGMERELLAAALRALIAQRLVRRRCDSCTGVTVSRDVRCPACGGSGYHGRIGIFRVTRVKEELRTAIRRGASEDELRRRIESTGAASLETQARCMIEDGVTTNAELARVMGVPTA